MQKRKLGCTELNVSVLGLGTVKWGRNTGVKYPHAFTLPSDAAIANLLSIARDGGMNLLDTAPAYGTSEERIGNLLTSRSDWVICTKVGEEFVNGESKFDFDSQTMMQSIERSLLRLKTDYLDIVLVHSNGEDDALIDAGVFDTLARLKIAGKIRAFGMSTKTLSGGLRTVELADVVMLTYHPHDQTGHAVLSQAALLNKGVLIKKALQSGHHAQNIAERWRFILAAPAVTSIVVGTMNPTHLQENINALLD